jgi:hypothetical protein
MHGHASPGPGAVLPWDGWLSRESFTCARLCLTPFGASAERRAVKENDKHTSHHFHLFDALSVSKGAAFADDSSPSYTNATWSNSSYASIAYELVICGGFYEMQVPDGEIPA